MNIQRQTIFRQKPVHYEVTGTATVCPPVMLLHGFTEDRRIWESIVPVLAEKYQFILPDLPGSGESPPNFSLTTLEDFAACIETIRQAEEINRMIVIGHSMGGYISVAYAEHYPERLAGLGLFHSTAKADTPEKKAAREKNQDFIRRNGSDVFVRQALPGLYSTAFRESQAEELEKQIAWYANFDPEILVLYLEAMKNRPDRTDCLRNTEVPVLIIMGQEDNVIPVADGLTQCHLPRISYFHILPQTAHMGMIENPILCIDCLDRFLDQFTW